MAILIKMEMPKNCDECPLNSTCSYSLHMSLYHTEKRDDNCPLIEVPEPNYDPNHRFVIPASKEEKNEN